VSPSFLNESGIIQDQMDTSPDGSHSRLSLVVPVFKREKARKRYRVEPKQVALFAVDRLSVSNIFVVSVRRHDPTEYYLWSTKRRSYGA